MSDHPEKEAKINDSRDNLSEKESKSEKVSWPKRAFSLFAWACVSASVYFIASNWPGTDQFAIMFEEGRWRAYFWMGAMIFSGQVLRGFRWAYLLSSESTFHWKSVIPIHGWYFLILAFSPMRSGEIGRILWAKSQGVSGSWATGTVIVERLFDVLILFSLLSVMLLTSPTASSTMINAALVWLFIIVIIYICLTFFSAKSAIFIENRFSQSATTWPAFVSAALVKLVNLLHGLSVIKVVKTNLVAMGMSIIIWIMVTLGYYFFLSALLPEVSYAAVVATVVFIAFSSFIGVAPGNVGIYEMAGLLALKSFGIEPDNALASVIWLHLASISLLVIYGLSCRAILARMGVPPI